MDYLKKTFRWFGPDFGVTLGDIKQIGVNGIVASCQEIPTGEVWPISAIVTLKNRIESIGLEWAVVESVNIHTSIKYGLPERDVHIENYIRTLRNLAQNGIHTVCYNFMQLIDWTRTDLDFQLPNGASTLCFDPLAAAAFDLFILKREGVRDSYDDLTFNKASSYFNALNAEGKTALEHAILAGMPGSRKLISLTEFRKNHSTVLKINKAQLQKNLAYFLQAVIPEAQKLDLNMAIHPDDPPYSVFGVPRIASNYEDLKFILNAYPSPNNGLTFCAGSLGASAENDLIKIIDDFGNKIHFIHLRNVERQDDGSFYEAAHLDGSLQMEEILKAIIREQKRRYASGSGEVAIPMRPDHGHVLLDDKKRQGDFYPGYSLIGRALGLAQLYGLEKGIRNAQL